MRFDPQPPRRPLSRIHALRGTCASMHVAKNAKEYKMKILLSVVILFLSVAPAQAALKVFACEPEWAALVQELGGAQVTVASATTALQDPHHIEARPRLIGEARPGRA